MLGREQNSEWRGSSLPAADVETHVMLWKRLPPLCFILFFFLFLALPPPPDPWSRLRPFPRLNRQQISELRRQVEELQKALQEQDSKTEDVSDDEILLVLLCPLPTHHIIPFFPNRMLCKKTSILT